MIADENILGAAGGLNGEAAGEVCVRLIGLKSLDGVEKIISFLIRRFGSRGKIERNRRRKRLIGRSIFGRL